MVWCLLFDVRFLLCVNCCLLIVADRRELIVVRCRVSLSAAVCCVGVGCSLRVVRCVVLCVVMF